MKNLEGILKLADNEMGAIVENGKFRSREEIDSIYKLVDITKDIYCIMDMEDEADDEYSGRGGNSYRYPRRMYDDGAYAGRRNAKRDSMGRYSRDGYSRGHDDYVEQLREMMQTAPDEQTRQSIQRMIQTMEQG